MKIQIILLIFELILVEADIYQIVTKTLDGSSADSEAPIFATIYGLYGTSDTTRIRPPGDLFDKGNVDVFTIDTGATVIGPLKKLKLESDDGDGWRWEWIEVTLGDSVWTFGTPDHENGCDKLESSCTPAIFYVESDPTSSITTDLVKTMTCRHWKAGSDTSLPPSAVFVHDVVILQSTRECASACCRTLNCNGYLWHNDEECTLVYLSKGAVTQNTTSSPGTSVYVRFEA